MKSQIICVIDENSTNCKVSLTGSGLDLIAMTACILKDLSDSINMPAKKIAELCSDNIDSLELVNQKENKPQPDGAFDISMCELQELLNDIYGKE